MEKWTAKAIEQLRIFVEDNRKYYPRLIESARIKLSDRGHYTICIVQQGMPVINDSNHSFTASAGEILIFRDKVIEVKPTDDSRILEILFVNDMFSVRLRQGRSINRLCTIYFDSLAFLDFARQLFFDICYVSEEDGAAKYIECQVKSLASRLIVLLNKGYGRRYSSRAVALMAALYISSNLRDDIRRNELCRLFGVSNKFLTQAFNENYLCSYAQYLLMMRLVYSQRILLQTDRLVEQVADDAGFHSVNHFIYSFRAKFGVTPLQFRKQVGHVAEMSYTQLQELFRMEGIPFISLQSPDNFEHKYSLQSTLVATYYVYNVSGTDIEISWLDFDGREVKYMTVINNSGVLQTAFVDHMFVVRTIEGEIRGMYELITQKSVLVVGEDRTL